MTNQKILSVIIPTYNRQQKLQNCLVSISKQTISMSDIEIHVIDDGSNDQTEQMVKNFKNEYQMDVHYYKINHKGPATARNVGLSNATGVIILFLDDDIVATPDLMAEHIDWHTKKYPEDNVAVLGYITYLPGIKIHRIMQYADDTGLQFGFGQITDPNNVPYNFFYTANISLKKRFISGFFFDEKFPFAAMEDIELSYRLKEKGLKTVFNKSAHVFHDTKFGYSQFQKRLRKSAYSNMIFIQKHHKELPTRYSNKELMKFIYKIPIYKVLLTFKMNLNFPLFIKYMVTYENEMGYRDYDRKKP